MLLRMRRHLVEGKRVGIKWLKEETKGVQSQEARGLQGPYPPNLSALLA